MDINNDRLLDLVTGDTNGDVTLFRNTGTKAEPALAAGEKLEADGQVITASKQTYKKTEKGYEVDKVVPGSNPLAEIYSKINVADWDGDGKLDLLVGHSSTIVLYPNVGTPEKPRFGVPLKIDPGKDPFPMRPSPYVVDWDGDGVRDLLVGSEAAEVWFYRNVGTKRAPKLTGGVKLDLKGDGFDKGYRCRIAVTDWNNDRKLDLLVGNFFSGQAGQTPQHGGNVWLFLGK